MNTRTAACVLTVLLAAAVPARAQDACEDSIYATVEGSTIDVFHDGATYNCCPTFGYTVDQIGDRIIVREVEVEGLCDCICCMDLSVAIEDVAPGEYTIEFHWFEYGLWEWWVWEIPVTVPDVGQGAGDPSVLAFQKSECYTHTAVFQAKPLKSWGMIKAMYR